MMRWISMASLLVGITSAAAPGGVVGGAFGQANAVANGQTPEQASQKEKPSPSAAASSTKALDMAVKALAKEYKAYEKDPSTKLRSESDYFKDGGVDVSADAVWTLLGRRLDANPAGDGYIKWQLLSASAATVDAKLMPKAIRAYRAAPLPLQRPGIATGNNQLTRALNGKKEAQLDKINEGLVAAVQAKATQNEPILKYRNALFERLLPSTETYEMGLRDYVSRREAGASAEELAGKIAAGIRAWAPTAKRPQINAVGQMLLHASQETGPEFYTGTKWDAKTGGTWIKAHVGQESANDLTALIGELQQANSTGKKDK